MTAGAWGDPEDTDLDREQEEAERTAVADQFCVIWSGEHRAYWRANASGYCADIRDAGAYRRAEAERLTRHCGPEKRIEIRPVQMVTITVPREIGR